jgi:phenylacetic acid degradation operon negative regulatory protein
VPQPGALIRSLEAGPDLMAATAGPDGLQPQDLVLTIFGSYVRRGELVWAGGMVEILEALGFSTGSARAALARLVNRDLLARTREGRRAFYSATRRAETLFAQGDRRIFSFGRAGSGEQLWTVVWHAIPEAQRVARSRFASQLRFLGFGSVQDATWVAARDRGQEVVLLLRELALERYASVMVGQMSPAVPPVALVAEAWRLAGAEDRYRAFLAEFGPQRAAAPRRASAAGRRASAAAAFRTRTLLIHRFREFPFIDPELPEQLDPLREIRGEVVARFDELYRDLEEPASRYFWQTVAPRGVGDEHLPLLRHG